MNIQVQSGYSLFTSLIYFKRDLQGLVFFTKIVEIFPCDILHIFLSVTSIYLILIFYWVVCMEFTVLHSQHPFWELNFHLLFLFGHHGMLCAHENYWWEKELVQVGWWEWSDKSEVKEQKCDTSRLFSFGNYKLLEWVTYLINCEITSFLSRNHPSDNAQPCK